MAQGTTLSPVTKNLVLELQRQSCVKQYGWHYGMGASNDGAQF
jgi:hypothetical protein